MVYIHRDDDGPGVNRCHACVLVVDPQSGQKSDARWPTGVVVNAWSTTVAARVALCPRPRQRLRVARNGPTSASVRARGVLDEPDQRRRSGVAIAGRGRVAILPSAPADQDHPAVSKDARCGRQLGQRRHRTHRVPDEGSDPVMFQRQ